MLDLNGYAVNFNGMIFVEGSAEEAQMIGSVKVDLSFKIGAQFKNLNDVKLRLAQSAAAMGANCVCQFTYGQKSRWLAIDDVAYFGSGYACVLSKADYDAAAERIRARDNKN